MDHKNISHKHIIHNPIYILNYEHAFIIIIIIIIIIKQILLKCHK